SVLDWYWLPCADGCTAGTQHPSSGSKGASGKIVTGTGVPTDVPGEGRIRAPPVQRTQDGGPVGAAHWSHPGRRVPFRRLRRIADRAGHLVGHERHLVLLLGQDRIAGDGRSGGVRS